MMQVTDETLMMQTLMMQTLMMQTLMMQTLMMQVNSCIRATDDFPVFSHPLNR